MSGDFVYQNETGDTSRASDNTCPECGSDTVYPDEPHGELVCDDCGCILKNGRIDRGAEWLAFTQKEEETHSRVGSPVSETVHDKGLTTHIHWRNVDAKGQQLSSRKTEQMNRLRRWQTRIKTERKGERNLQFALTEIHRMASALELPDTTRKVAASFYREALDNDLIRGRSIEAMATSALYVACRKEEIPRSLDEFDEVARVDRTEIARAYRHFASERNLAMQPVDPVRFVPRFCSDLEVEAEVQQTARDILEQVKDEGLHAGKSPASLAAAAIYIAAKEHDLDRTQAEIADTANITKITLRKRYKEQLTVVE